MYKFFVFVVLLVYVFKQNEALRPMVGNCETHLTGPTITDFDVEKYAGVYYVTHAADKVVFNCGRMEYVSLGGGKFLANLTTTDNKSGKVKSVTGVGYALNREKHHGANYRIDFKVGLVPRHAIYKVPYNVWGEYSTSWLCTSVLPMVNLDTAFILSKNTPTIDNGVLNQIKANLTLLGFDVDRLTEVKNENCTYF